MTNARRRPGHPTDYAMLARYPNGLLRAADMGASRRAGAGGVSA